MTLEQSILLWIQAVLRTDILTPFFIFITRLGDHGGIWIVITIGLLLFKKTRNTGIMSGMSLMGSLLINNIILKNLIVRIRPYEVIEGLERLIEKQTDFSFPSGHTGSSFASAVILFLCLPRKYGIPAMSLAVLIGFSRLYIGVHYPTDVIAGAVIGSLIAVGVYKLCAALHKKIWKKGW